MFLLHDMSDTIRIPPKYFDREKRATLTKLIEDKYCNRVVRNVGLCVCLHDFIEIKESFIYPGDGAAHTDVRFSIVVFKPFVGEILEGLVQEINKDLVRVTLGFYNDIYVAASSLQQPSEFVHAQEGVAAHWSWKWFESDQNQGGEDAAEEDRDDSMGYYIELGQRLRVRVRSVEFGAYCEENTEGEAAGAASRERSNSEVIRTLQNSAPMVIMAQCREPYLGAVEWWEETEDDQFVEGADLAQDDEDAADADAQDPAAA